jgi:hypothetical protein
VGDDAADSFLLGRAGDDELRRCGHGDCCVRVCSGRGEGVRASRDEMAMAMAT